MSIVDVVNIFSIANIVNILSENTSAVNKTEEQTNTPGLKIPECPVCLTEMGAEVL